MTKRSVLYCRICKKCGKNYIGWTCPTCKSRVKKMLYLYKSYGIDLDEDLTAISFQYNPDLAEDMFMHGLKSLKRLKDDEKGELVCKLLS